MLGIILTLWVVRLAQHLMDWCGLMSLAVLFSIVTLPVEFDASSRAMKQITALNIVNEKEYKHAKRFFQPRNDLCCATAAVAELVRIILIARASDN